MSSAFQFSLSKDNEVGKLLKDIFCFIVSSFFSEATLQIVYLRANCILHYIVDEYAVTQ